MWIWNAIQLCVQVLCAGSSSSLALFVHISPKDALSLEGALQYAPTYVFQNPELLSRTTHRGLSRAQHPNPRNPQHPPPSRIHLIHNPRNDLRALPRTIHDRKREREAYLGHTQVPQRPACVEQHGGDK